MPLMLTTADELYVETIASGTGWNLDEMTGDDYEVYNAATHQSRTARILEIVAQQDFPYAKRWWALRFDEPVRYEWGLANREDGFAPCVAGQVLDGRLVINADNR